MTFSIVARSEDGTHLGVAVASKFLAVGAAVPAARAGHGALATQAWANLGYKAEGLTLLADGLNAHATIDALIAGDDMREHRQIGVVDARGNAETYTGSECMNWAGGDSRGRQSAALLVVTPGGGYGGGTDVQVDLRVDDHTEPIPELSRLLGIHDLLFGEPDPERLLDLAGDLLIEVRDRLSALGFAAADESVAAIEQALDRWAGRENFEARLVEGRLDPVVLDQLRRA